VKKHNIKPHYLSFNWVVLQKCFYLAQKLSIKPIFSCAAGLLKHALKIGSTLTSRFHIFEIQQTDFKEVVH
jgi:hypothetical protein